MTTVTKYKLTEYVKIINGVVKNPKKPEQSPHNAYGKDTGE